MEFSKFKDSIVKIIEMDLPGEEFHLKMAPIERLLELKRLAYEKKTARKAAVLVLFYPTEKNKTNFVLILRKTYKGVHSAQIGFPGGKMEATDANYRETALRETEEEVGVYAENVKIFKELTEIYIPPSNFFVQPYMAITEESPKFVAQEDEVEAIIEVPLEFFMDDKVINTMKVTTSYAENIEVPIFKINEYNVWGATAMMLNEVRELLKPNL